MTDNGKRINVAHLIAMVTAINQVTPPDTSLHIKTREPCYEEGEQWDGSIFLEIGLPTSGLPTSENWDVLEAAHRELIELNLVHERVHVVLAL